MRSSKLSLRQKVMQKNSRLIRRREVYGKHVPATGMYNVLHVARSWEVLILVFIVAKLIDDWIL